VPPVIPLNIDKTFTFNISQTVATTPKKQFLQLSRIMCLKQTTVTILTLIMFLTYFKDLKVLKHLLLLQWYTIYPKKTAIIT